jgi:Asp-tRNA(Asn)/Glu-tRNA(Gln) amidotransferase A subunit family amidase
VSLDTATATADEVSRAIRGRQISSRELLDGLLARAERVNPALNAIVAWDVDRARAAANAADDATARGEFSGPERQRVAWAEFFRRYDVAPAPVMPTAAFPHDTERPIVMRTLDVDGVTVPHFAVAAWCCARSARCCCRS